MNPTKNKPLATLFALIIFSLSFCLSPVHLLHAQQAVLSWQAEQTPDAEGVFTLLLSADLPTAVTDAQVVVTFDEAQVAYLDYELLVSGLESSIDTSEAGLLSLAASGATLDAGNVNLVKFRFKMKAAGSAEITLARSRFTSTNGERVPATMMLGQSVDYTPVETSAASSDTSSSTQASSEGKTQNTNTSATKTQNSSQTQSADTSLSTESGAIGKDEETGSGLGTKLALLMGSLVLAGLIFLILKLSRNNSNSHRR